MSQTQATLGLPSRKRTKSGSSKWVPRCVVMSVCSFLTSQASLALVASSIPCAPQTRPASGGRCALSAPALHFSAVAEAVVVLRRVILVFPLIAIHRAHHEEHHEHAHAKEQ